VAYELGVAAVNGGGNDEHKDEEEGTYCCVGKL